MPNLVQTLENNPAFVHGGPFANIAHGCNSVLATKTALKLADYVVTEAGFGFDLGAEKFFDIKCRKAGLDPAAVVLVATVRALKMHGGVAKDDLKTENVSAVAKGCENLARHLENLRKFGVPPVVAINRFITDTDEEVAEIVRSAESAGAKAHLCTHWADGGKGIEGLARQVVDLADSGKSKFKPLYPDEMPLRDKMKTIATEIYGASDIACDAAVETRFRELQAAGYGHLPVCMAKTQYSFSDRPQPQGRADRPRRADPGTAAVGRRRVHRRHHRRDHDHARPAQDPRRQHHPPQRQGPDRGAVLIFCGAERGSERSTQHRGERVRKGERREDQARVDGHGAGAGERTDRAEHDHHAERRAWGLSNASAKHLVDCCGMPARRSAKRKRNTKESCKSGTTSMMGATARAE